MQPPRGRSNDAQVDLAGSGTPPHYWRVTPVSPIAISACLPRRPPRRASERRSNREAFGVPPHHLRRPRVFLWLYVILYGSSIYYRHLTLHIGSCVASCRYFLVLMSLHLRCGRHDCRRKCDPFGPMALVPASVPQACGHVPFCRTVAAAVSAQVSVIWFEYGSTHYMYVGSSMVQSTVLAGYW